MDQTPERAAETLLDFVWHNKGFPVDPAQIAGELGLRVLEADLNENVSGALIKEAGKDPVIFLNRSDSNNRKRFSCAHELGHYSSRQRDNKEAYEYVDLRSELAKAGVDPEEIYANKFAAALLMPEEEVRRLYKTGADRVAMAYHFGVSDDAMRIRMRTLKLT